MQSLRALAPNAGAMDRDAAPASAVLLADSGIPDRGRNDAFRKRLLREVVYGNDFAVGALRAADRADVPGGAVFAKNDIFAPGPAVVFAEPRPNAVGLAAIAVGEADPAILKPDHAGRIAAVAARARRRPAQKLPVRAVVARLVEVDPVVLRILFHSHGGDQPLRR